MSEFLPTSKSVTLWGLFCGLKRERASTGVEWVPEEGGLPKLASAARAVYTAGNAPSGLLVRVAQSAGEVRYDYISAKLLT
jgi:hypothetical protein